ncbi:MAG: hypothetical protein ACXQT5_05990 [Candidatus Syntropharchaeia archaeon]
MVSVAFSLFWALLGISYLFAVFYTLIPTNTSFFTISIVSLALMASPLAYFILHLLIGEKKINLGVSLFFGVAGLAFILLLFNMGISGYERDFWGVQFILDENLVKFFVYGFFIPSFSMIMAFLPFIAIRRIPKIKKYKITLSLISLSLVYDFILLEVLGTGGVFRVISDSFILLGVLIGYLAYFPPESLSKALKLEGQEFEFEGVEGF